MWKRAKVTLLMAEQVSGPEQSNGRFLFLSAAFVSLYAKFVLLSTSPPLPSPPPVFINEIPVIRRSPICSKATLSTVSSVPFMVGLSRMYQCPWEVILSGRIVVSYQ